MALTKLIIATNLGPVHLLSLNEEAGAVRSRMMEVNSFQPLRLSNDYHHFVESLVLKSTMIKSSYEAKFNKPIDRGNSWNLGMFIAHASHKQGILVEAQNFNSEDHVIWATGEIKNNESLSLIAVDSVAEKLKQSAPLFKQVLSSGAKLSICLPIDNNVDIDSELRINLEKRGVQILCAATAPEMIKKLDLMAGIKEKVVEPEVIPLQKNIFEDVKIPNGFFTNKQNLLMGFLILLVIGLIYYGMTTIMNKGEEQSNTKSEVTQPEATPVPPEVVLETKPAVIAPEIIEIPSPLSIDLIGYEGRDALACKENDYSSTYNIGLSENPSQPDAIENRRKTCKTEIVITNRSSLSVTLNVLLKTSEAKFVQTTSGLNPHDLEGGHSIVFYYTNPVRLNSPISIDIQLDGKQQQTNAINASFKSNYSMELQPSTDTLFN